MKVLALDLGKKRIGVAVSDSQCKLAVPVGVIKRSDTWQSDISAISDMVVRLGASKVVVGLPLSLNGKEGQAALDATCEAKSLSEALTVPVVLHDERFSTAVAHNYFKETGTSHKKRRDKIDAAAATVILQSWLDCYGDSTSANSGGGFAPSKRF